jgi:hypothetical protein
VVVGGTGATVVDSVVVVLDVRSGPAQAPIHRIAAAARVMVVLIFMGGYLSVVVVVVV